MTSHETENNSRQKRDFIDDSDGLRGSCKKCSEHYETLLKELEEIKFHGSAMRRVRANQVKNKPNVQ